MPATQKKLDLPTYTEATLYERIRAHMEAHESSPDVACVAIFEEINANTTELKRWWRALGVSWLKHVEVRQSNVTRPMAPVAAAKRSWTASFREPAAFSIWDTEIPIGNRGVRKRLGDLNKDDVLTIGIYYRGYGQTLLAKGDAWHKIAELMPNEGTLEQLAIVLDEELLNFVTS